MLETTWFLLWGVLWAVYFMLDGFDLGIGTLLPFLGKSETDKRMMYNAAGPFWDGNEVWLITAGGVTFAAFPKTYAVMFSSFYLALLLLLFALIFRGVTFEFRNKVDSAQWRKIWDICHFLGSFLPALLLGVAFSNIFMGIPLDANGVNQGSFFSLLNPYALVGGLFFVMLFVYHGALWLAIRTSGDLHERALRAAKLTWPYMLCLALIYLVSTAYATKLYDNYRSAPLLTVFILLPVIGIGLTRIFLGLGKVWSAWALSSVGIVGVALFGVIGLYPALLPSSLNPAWSMTISNSASSPLTLKIMLGVALTCVPIVIIYQTWVYKNFCFKLTEKDLAHDESY